MSKKRFLFFLLFIPTILCGSEWDQVDFYEEEAAQLKPFGINGTYLNVKNAASLSDDIFATHLHYVQSDASFAFTYPCSPYNGFIFGIGWVGTEVNVTENPFFDETNFNYVTFSLGAFSKSLCDWLWTATFSVLMDTQEISLADYALYQGTLWGKYNPNPCWEIDVGFIAEVGLHKEKIWPILGFIYNYSPTTRLHFVYPVDIMLERDFGAVFTAAASVRFLRNRHRVLADNPLPRAIFEYRSTGVELDLICTPWDCFSIEGFVGTAFGTNFKVTNENNHDPVYFTYKNAPYAGVSAQLSF